MFLSDPWTHIEKKLNMIDNENGVNKKGASLIFLFSIIVFFLSCSSSLNDEQLKFGIQAAQKDLWDEAIFRWKKVLRSTPNSAAAHNNLAVAYEKKGLLEEAKKEYETALKISPENSSIKSNYQSFKEYYSSVKEENEKEN
jgi:tetratricopeptide (TPR) repeat protein